MVTLSKRTRCRFLQVVIAMQSLINQRLFNMTQNVNYILVAAIDFGTTYSGYAFSMKDTFKRDPLSIHANQAWNAGGKQLLSLKTPTCLLLNSEKRFDSFGYEAENKYADLVMDENHEDYYYFHRFKMSLHNNKNVTSGMLIEDITGKSLPAIDVFAHAIKALKDHLMDILITRGTGLKPNEIQWVLTVPAIWTDKSKQFMRQSSVKAGIPDDCLLIALEPEAASIYCQYLPTEKLSGPETTFTLSKPRTKYLVVDLGGGTADITAHEKLNHGSLKELCRASGGDCGGTSVDAAFIEMIGKIVGAPVIQTLKKDNPQAYLDLLREFETVKRNITPAKTGKVNMTIPYATLDSLCKQNLRKDLASALGVSALSNTVSLRGDKIRIDTEVFMTLFDKTIRKILDLITEILGRKEAASISIILLVGGFSESKLIQNAIREGFERHRVVVPEDAGLSVLKGAVIFGHNPSSVLSRISRFKYGIAVDVVFDPEKHDRKHLKFVDGIQRCHDGFDIIMEKDVVVQAGTKVKKLYESSKGDDEITFRVFVTENAHPKYVDEEGCSLLGEAKIAISDPSEAQSIDVEIVFGNTEVSMKAVEKKSGNTCETTFGRI